jgi:hypothetical protein
VVVAYLWNYSQSEVDFGWCLKSVIYLVLNTAEGSVLIFLPESCCWDVQQFAVLRNGSSG